MKQIKMMYLLCLNQIKKDDDIIITMGAGDIWKYGEQFVEMLNQRTKNVKRFWKNIWCYSFISNSNINFVLISFYV